MALTNPSTFGKKYGVDTAGSEWALFQSLNLPNCLQAYEYSTVTKGKAQEKDIASGDGLKFPVIGRGNAAFMPRGSNLDTIRGTSAGDAEVAIIINAPLVSSERFTDDEVLRSINDAKNKKISQCYTRIAQSRDQALFAAVADACIEQNENIDFGKPVLKRVVNASFAKGYIDSTFGGQISDSLLALAAEWDDNAVPAEGRFVFMRSSAFASLRSTLTVLDRDYGATASLGGYENFMLHGMHIIRTPHLVANRIANTGNVHPSLAPQPMSIAFPSDYVDSVLYVAWQSDAVGVLTRQGITSENQRDLNTLSTLYAVYIFQGFGVIRPEGCGMAYGATTANP